MDIENLIADLQEISQKNSISHYKRDRCAAAATALSTLQAENEKLRDEVERQRRSADNRKHLYENAERAYMKVLAELEQAKTEITRLKHYEDKCHDCPIVCAKTEIIKAHEELEAVQAELEQKSKLIAQQAAELERRDKLLKEQETELDQMKRERDAAIDCIYKIEDALDRGNDNDWAREHISEWESQKEV